MTDGAFPEFSRPRPAVNLPSEGRAFSAAASADECRALATRLGLLAIGRLRVEGLMRPRSKGKQVVLQAALSAEVTQRCVVSLEPVVNTIDVAFERVFEFGIGDEWAQFGDASRDLVLGTPEIDAADPIFDDAIDIGEAAAEQLALELDPFPRAPGAVFESLENEPIADVAAEAAHPFAALNRLRKGD